MITGRVCDRCGEPVPVECVTMDWRNEDGREPDRAHNDLCNDCANELYRWLTVPPEEILEARRTPLMRYAETLRTRAETMPLKEALGEMPEGIIVFYPDERYGIVSFQKGIGMTILGKEKVSFRTPYGWNYNTLSLYEDREDGPSVGLTLANWRSVEVEPFTLGGRTGRVVNAEQLGPRENPPDWW